MDFILLYVMNKRYLFLLTPLYLLSSCSTLSAYYQKLMNPVPKTEGTSIEEAKEDPSKSDFSPKPDPKTDSPCKITFDKALTNVNKDIPLIGADLDGYTNLLAQYLNCEMVKRDDRIAEVLLKLLKRIDELENEVSTLKGN